MILLTGFWSGSTQRRGPNVLPDREWARRLRRLCREDDGDQSSGQQFHSGLVGGRMEDIRLSAGSKQQWFVCHHPHSLPKLFKPDIYWPDFQGLLGSQSTTLNIFPKDCRSIIHFRTVHWLLTQNQTSLIGELYRPHHRGTMQVPVLHQSIVTVCYTFTHCNRLSACVPFYVHK